MIFLLPAPRSSQALSSIAARSGTKLVSHMCCPGSVGVKSPPPLKYFDMAASEGKRTISLQGSDFKGEGVKSTMQCAGCRQNMENVIDCLWEDEICMYEITPNDVLSVVNA